MNPTIEAAWIGALTGGVGIIGAVIVAIAANRNARKTNSQTIEAGTASMVRTLDAGDDKLWDKRTATCEEIMAYLLFLQAKRRLELRRRFIRYDKEHEEASERLVGDYKPASWWEMQARLAAYGSPEALTGFEA